MHISVCVCHPPCPLFLENKLIYALYPVLVVILDLEGVFFFGLLNSKQKLACCKKSDCLSREVPIYVIPQLFQAL